MREPVAGPATKASLLGMLRAMARDVRRERISIGDLLTALGDRAPAALRRHADRVRSQPFRPQLSPVVALASLALLTACGPDPELPPLPSVSLERSQSEALERMNAAGAAAFAGWTWRYEFGAGCRMRIIKRYEDRPIPVNEFVLTDHYTEIVHCPGAGYGVKAYSRAKPGNADLFDARTEPEAAAFAKDVEYLLTACGNAVNPAR